MNIVSSHFVPSEHPYQIIFDRDSRLLGMQIGTLIVLDNSPDTESTKRSLFRAMPVVTYTCKTPIFKYEENSFNDMNMPILIEEAIVWENCIGPMRVCTEDNKHISLNKFNYLAWIMYAGRIKDLHFFDTPDSLQNKLERLGITVDWPKEKEQEITLVRAQSYTKDGIVGHWCQSKDETGLYFYAKDDDEKGIDWFIMHQAYFYYTQNKDYIFRFKTEVPEYKESVEKINRMVNHYCKHPK